MALDTWRRHHGPGLVATILEKAPSCYSVAVRHDRTGPVRSLPRPFPRLQSARAAADDLVRRTLAHRFMLDACGQWLLERLNVNGATGVSCAAKRCTPPYARGYPVVETTPIHKAAGHDLNSNLCSVVGGAFARRRGRCHAGAGRSASANISQLGGPGHDSGVRSG